MMTRAQIETHLLELGNADFAQHMQRYFKTGKGEYGEGDRFIGLRMPHMRALSKDYKDLPLRRCLALLKSHYHEARMLALLILIHQFKAGDAATQKDIYQHYLAHSNYINNWDFIDTSAPHIVGTYLIDKNRRPLYKLARSKSLWERRISIMACFAFIKACDYTDALKIAAMLRDDEHDLIHKATGWMLREVGKRDLATEESFLKQHYQHMPRTMLRYAIERFPERKRKAYLKGTVSSLLASAC